MTNNVPLLFVLHPHLGGWRWAIMRATLEELLAEPTRRCVNAGREDTREAADTIGQYGLYSILSFAAGIGVTCPVSNVSLDYDPIPEPTPASTGDAVEVTSQVLQIGGR